MMNMWCERPRDVMKWFLAGIVLSSIGGVCATAFMHYVVGP